MYSNLEQVIADKSIHAVYVSTIFLILLAAVSLMIKKMNSTVKKTLFACICFVTVSCTLFLAGSTLYLNSISTSQGPIHYHADFEVWACGKEYELVDPTGWSNKIGTPTLHEHNDKRIHLEGVIVNKQDASIGKFFKVVGGSISSSQFMMPATTGPLILKTGDKCPDGIPATLQVFVYKVIQKTAIQTKVTAPASYVISPQSQVPPGDCIIIEFGKNKAKTDHICRSFLVAKQIGKLE